jgi:hypothetical protein
MFQFKASSLACLVIIAVVGCGSSNERMRVYKVSGTVNFEGEPMQGGGAITFVPTGTQQGKAPGGEIDDSGNYTLNTYVEGDGAVPGSYRVVIAQVTAEEPEATPDGTPPPVAQKALPEKFFIPTIYADFSKSPLKATVEDNENAIDFNLKRAESGGVPQVPVQRGA